MLKIKNKKKEKEKREQQREQWAREQQQAREQREHAQQLLRDAATRATSPPAQSPPGSLSGGGGSPIATGQVGSLPSIASALSNSTATRPGGNHMPANGPSPLSPQQSHVSYLHQSSPPPGASGPLSGGPMRSNAPAGPPNARRGQPTFPWSIRKLQQTIPFPRCDYALCSVGQQEMCLFGGLCKEGPQNDIYLIDTSTLIVTHVLASGDQPLPRDGHTAVCDNQWVIVFGGESDDGKCEDSLFAFNLDSRQWQQIYIQGTVPLGRRDHTATMVNGVMFVFGGQSDGCFLNDLMAFDLRLLNSPSPHWEYIKPANAGPSGRAGHSATIYQDRLYVFGGTDGETFFNEMWCYDLRTCVWDLLRVTGHTPPGRAGHAAALVDDCIYVTGGKSASGKNLSDVVAFRIRTMRWYTFQKMGPAPTSRSGHSMCVFGTKVFVLSGEAREGEDPADIHVLEAGKIKYPAAPPLQPRPSIGAEEHGMRSYPTRPPVTSQAHSDQEQSQPQSTLPASPSPGMQRQGTMEQRMGSTVSSPSSIAPQQQQKWSDRNPPRTDSPGRHGERSIESPSNVRSSPLATTGGGYRTAAMEQHDPVMLRVRQDTFGQESIAPEEEPTEMGAYRTDSAQDGTIGSGTTSPIARVSDDRHTASIQPLRNQTMSPPRYQERNESRARGPESVQHQLAQESVGHVSMSAPSTSFLPSEADDVQPMGAGHNLGRQRADSVSVPAGKPSSARTNTTIVQSTAEDGRGAKYGSMGAEHDPGTQTHSHQSSQDGWATSQEAYDHKFPHAQRDERPSPISDQQQSTSHNYRSTVAAPQLARIEIDTELELPEPIPRIELDQVESFEPYEPSQNTTTAFGGEILFNMYPDASALDLHDDDRESCDNEDSADDDSDSHDLDPPTPSHAFNGPLSPRSPHSPGYRRRESLLVYRKEKRSSRIGNVGPASPSGKSSRRRSKRLSTNRQSTGPSLTMIVDKLRHKRQELESHQQLGDSGDYDHQARESNSAHAYRSGNAPVIGSVESSGSMQSRPEDATRVPVELASGSLAGLLSSEDIPVLPLFASDLESDANFQAELGPSDGPRHALYRAFVQLAKELQLTKTAVAESAREAAERVREAEKAKQSALHESAYMKAKLVAMSNGSSRELSRIGEQRVTDLERKLSAALAENDQLREQLTQRHRTAPHDAEMRRRATEVADETAVRIRELERLHAEARDQASEARNDIARVEANSRDAISRQLSAEQAVTSKERQLEDMERQLDQHRRAAEAATQAVRSANARADESEAMWQQTEARVANLELELDGMRGELQAKTTELERQRTRTADMERMWRAARNQVAELESIRDMFGETSMQSSNAHGRQGSGGSLANEANDSRLHDLEAQLHAQEVKMHHIDEAMRQSEDVRQSAENRAVQAEKLYAKAQSELAAFRRRSVFRHDQQANMSAELAAFESRIRAKQAECDEAQARAAALLSLMNDDPHQGTSSDTQVLVDRLVELEREREQYESTLSGLRAELSRRQHDRTGFI